MNIAEFGKSQSWCVTFPWVTETSEDETQNRKHQIRIYKENCTKYMFVWIMSSMQTPYDWTAGLLSYTGWSAVQVSCICQVCALIAMSTLILNHHACVTRFRDSKATFGKLQFFSHLCKKLHQDMEEFAEILSPSRKGGLNHCTIV